MVQREKEKECGGKCEMKAKLKVTFLLRKIKTKSLASTKINSENELRYVKKKKIKKKNNKCHLKYSNNDETPFSKSSLPWVSFLSFSTCPPGHIHPLVVVYSSSF